jgi:alkylhydroperoxidase family enzyme
MARLPYADPQTHRGSALVERIRAERGDVLHLYAMLLHSAPMTEGWLALFTAVRQKGVLPGDLRELVIMQVALLNGAPYEAQQHRPIALREGLSEEKIDGLGTWRSLEAYTPRERAVLAYCEQMTRNVHVDDAVFAAVRDHFDDRMMVELTVTIAGYNMVSRVLEALSVDASDDKGDWS